MRSDLLDVAARILRKDDEHLSRGVVDLIKSLTVDGDLAWPEDVPTDEARMGSIAVLLHTALMLFELGRDGSEDISPTRDEIAVAAQMVVGIRKGGGLTSSGLAAILDGLSEQVVTDLSQRD